VPSHDGFLTEADIAPLEPNAVLGNREDWQWVKGCWVSGSIAKPNRKPCEPLQRPALESTHRR
jgi:hypothetical protein